MAGLFDFIAGIGTAISALFNFVVSLIQDIVYMVQLTGNFNCSRIVYVVIFLHPRENKWFLYR